MTKRLGFRDATTGTWTWKVHAPAQQVLRLHATSRQSRDPDGDRKTKNECGDDDDASKENEPLAQPTDMAGEEDVATQKHRVQAEEASAKRQTTFGRIDGAGAGVRPTDACA